jgi:hypothetical protein
MNFNDNHRKWAMTGVLLAVLGFNISPPKSMISFSLTDMASTSEVKSSTIEVNGQKYVAQYVKSGERTDVKVDKVEFETESGSLVLCGSCSTTYVFDKNFTTNIAELNDITRETVAAKSKKEAAVADRGSERVKATKKDKEEVAKGEDGPSLSSEDKKASGKPDGVEKLQAVIDKDCAKLKSDDGHATCAITRIENLLKHYEAFSIDRNDLSELIKKEVLSPLGNVVADIREDNDMSLQQTSAYEQEKTIKPQIEEALEPMYSLIKKFNEKDKVVAKQLKKEYQALFDTSLSKLNKAKSENNLAEMGVRTEDVRTLLKLMIQKENQSTIVNGGMAQANSMSSGLEKEIQNRLNAIYGVSTNGTTTGANGTIVAQDGSRFENFRGGVNQAQMNTTGAASVPNVVLQQTPQGGMAIIIPNQNSSNQYNSMQPMNTTSVGGVPVAVMQQQVVPSTPQYYQQPQQMYGQQQVYNPQQYNTTQYNPYVNQYNGTQYSVPQTNAGSVVNMGTYRAGTVGTTTSTGIGIVPRQ